MLKEHGFALKRRPRGNRDIRNNGEIETSVPAKIKKRHTANGILKEAGLDAKL